MADVSAHEDESVGGRPCETADVADAVARGVEEVEGAIAEEVECAEVSDFEVRMEWNLAELATFEERLIKLRF